MEDFVLEPGHLVMHKAVGAPEMCVESIVENEDGRTQFRCGWFDDKKCLRRENFYLHELVLVSYTPLDAAEKED